MNLTILKNLLSTNRRTAARTAITNASKLAASLAAVALLLALTACGGGGSGNINVTAVAITPTAANVNLNQQVQFTATVTLANGTDTSNTLTPITWYVNGIAGGNSSIGTITTSTLSVQVGIYTAPATANGVGNNGVVQITGETPQFPNQSTKTTTITSNSASVTVGLGSGLSVSPTAATVPAGGSFQFSGILNNVSTTDVTWAISSANGGNIGSIDPNTGIYTAPLYPPPGGVITVTGTSGTLTATATAQIVYSAASLTGPFAFSYSGNNNLGLLAVAGSFVADGNGKITSGLSDSTGFLGGPSGGVSFTGTYTVGPDGRGSAVISAGPGGGTTSAWAFVMTNNQHAYMTRFNANITGSGQMDQQNLNDLTTSDSVITGPYVFRVSGSNAQFEQLAAAGRFTASGTGVIPQSDTVVDWNNDGTVTPADTTLHGTYAFDTTQPNTGRGTMQLSSTAIGTLNFAFYTVDNTHLRIVETDQNDYLAGEIFSGLPNLVFNAASLPSGNYPFTVGGTSPTGAYALGGIFVSDGNGNITSGVSDSNNSGTVALNTTLSASTYSVNPDNSRIALTLNTGTTPSTFSAYPTSAGSVLMLELDSAAVAAGTAYTQTGSPTAPPAGSVAMGIGAQGIFYNNASAYGQNLDAQVNFISLVASGGNIDINNYNAVYPGDPVNTTTTGTATMATALTAATAPGRGTGILSGKNPNVTFGFVYYLVNADTALTLGSDTTRTNLGQFILQF